MNRRNFLGLIPVIAVLPLAIPTPPKPLPVLFAGKRYKVATGGRQQGLGWAMMIATIHRADRIPGYRVMCPAFDQEGATRHSELAKRVAEQMEIPYVMSDNVMHLRNGSRLDFHIMG